MTSKPEVNFRIADHPSRNEIYGDRLRQTIIARAIMGLASGTRLGPYEIQSPLGAGGMGEVYRARDTRLGREVAVKVLPAIVLRDPERLRRFQREAQAIAALNHPNILAIHDFGEHEGLPFIITELLEGETLRTRLKTTPLSVRKARDAAEQIAHGLAAAHDKGVVHRDLKPENIFVTRDGRVKILDFGLAKMTFFEAVATDAATLASQTEPGMVMGTVAYMSPEQVRGKTVDHRSDLFFRSAKAGRIPCFHVGSCVRFDPRQVANWLRRT
jgi:eukaryotic-like serine/threonine-protein kinase